MSSKHNEQVLPKLRLLYGFVDKVWPLAGEVTAVGRARGCDISLEASDISSLHCLIWRSPGGLRVRDCGSRAGTHVNGERIDESALADRDLLQIGPFSFEVSVPPSFVTALSPEARCRHLNASRRRLADLALEYRRRFREATRQDALASAPLELHRQASGLRRRYKDLEQRLRQLDEAERELSRDRELFDRDCRERFNDP